MKDKPKWKDPSTHDKETAILRELRVGVMSAQLANKVGSDWTEVDLLLAELARRGEVRCTNKLWYRTDLEPKLRPPRAPRLNAEYELFLKKQGRLF